MPDARPLPLTATSIHRQFNLNRIMTTNTPLIVCGTDFSDNASRASDVAAALAVRQGATLALVHVADEADVHTGTPSEYQTFIRPIKARLKQEAQRLRKAGATVEEVMLHGEWAEEAMMGYLKAHPAELVVVSSVSKTAFERWTLGSVSERIAERSPVPTLVVRSPETLLAWVQQKRPLNVFVTVDFSTSSDAALAWVAQLRRFGDCAVTLAHVNWPAEEARWLGPGKTVPLTKNTPAMRRRLLREIQKKARTWLGDTEVNVHLEPNWGRPDAALVVAATEAEADLVVAGVHHRHGIEKLTHRSISRGILRHSPANVACVPTSPALAHGIGRPVEIRRVLAATDFSTTGDQAVAWAFAALPTGGTLRLIHVSPPMDTYAAAVARPGSKRISAADHRRRVNEARQKLAALIPPGSADRGVQTEVDVLVDREPARAIGADARRFGPDLLCLGSRGQGRLAEALLGSVAKSVMSESDQPVLLVRPSPP